MAFGRRTIDRRRRVLYSTQQADLVTSTAASRRAAEHLREARKPTEAFGSRVHRRLRGRWFSLVPVKRRTLVGVSGAMFLVVLLLLIAHYASVAWPSIANRPEIARPLRLDRADSFGKWVEAILLALSAGASLLIYQVRRYRIDDYVGQYRLWRLVIITLVLASVHSLVGVVDWAGAILDSMLGQRVALAGNDWLRVVLSLGGAILALRMIAEVRRSTWSLLTMIATWTFLAIPASANWNFISVDTLNKWTVVTCLPLVASATLFASLGGYLRMLVRQVRKLDEKDSIADRLEEFKQKWLTRSKDSNVEEQPSEKTGPRKPEPRLTKQAEPTPTLEADAVDEPAKKKRRWFGLRAAKTESTPNADTDSAASDEEPAKHDDLADDLALPEASGGDAGIKKRRFSLGFLKRKPKSPAATDEEASDGLADEDEAPVAAAQPRKPPLQANRRRQEDLGDSDDGNPSVQQEDVDWDSLSKTERRRLRKQLKRQGRAA
ncbi:hypothetical protein Q31b_46560 [Novipirellula aureliae]|uniref:Uncharacterized protein n=2 Tax=Novipirellula aureliae TaxID=2527966 RepID=A0A5C6DPT4_9BACT|nr:hypothetical protein Q31b_46560 [Novipirellula aureliae]